MKPSGITVVAGAFLTIACASPPPASVPAPVRAPANVPAQPVAAPPAPTIPAPSSMRNGAWNFAYTPGTYTYSLTTKALIAPVSDSIQKREVPEQDQKATITLSATGDVQVVDPAPVTSSVCDANATLTTLAQQIIPKLPAHLASGDHWRDSTTTSGCRGMIAAESVVISNYTVAGDTTFGNVSAVQIHRIDSLSANGQGSEGQHRITISANGTGSTDLFLDVATGRLVGSRGLQTSLVNVTTSGRLAQFIQRVTELITLVGAQ